MTITARSAADFTFDELADAMNLAYAGYVMPVQVDGGWMEHHVTRNDVRLEASPVWVEGDAVVGLALVGLRGTRAWLGGFGIVPASRGRGLAGPLLGDALAAAWAGGARHMQLEVISTNAAAIRVYERGGFHVTREVGVYRRDAMPVSATPDEVGDADPKSVLAQREHLGGSALAWQRESMVVTPADAARALVCSRDDPRGYVVWQSGTRGTEVIDIGGTSQTAIVAILTALASQSGGRSMTLLNEPVDSLAIEALVATGWQEVVRQLEMARAITW